MTVSRNVEFVRRAYEAISTADIPWMAEHTADDVVFHQGGRFPTAGSYNGRDAMFGHFMEFTALVDGKLTLDLVDVLASDDRAAAVLSVTIEYEGRQLQFDEVHLWRLDGDKLVEMHALPFEPYDVDAFFAAASSG